MRKSLLSLILLVFTVYTVYAQNTYPWPSTGNIGIGTTAPGSSLVIQATTPELRFINTADSTNFARFLRKTTSNNLFKGNNKVIQAGGISKALYFSGSPSNQNVTIPENGLSTSSGFIISFWFNAASVANQGLFGFSQPTSSSTTNVSIHTNSSGNLMAVAWNNPNGTFGIQGPVLNNNTNYHVVYYYQPGGVRLFVNNVEYTTHYGAGGYYWPQVSGQTFYLGYAPYVNIYASSVTVDQVLFYSSLNSTDLATLYNSGNGTGNIPTTGLIRRYDFEEGTGTTAADGLLTGYDATLNNSVQWKNSGIIPLPSSPVDANFFSISDGLTNTERGIATWGDFNGRNQQQGKWFQWKQGSNYPLVSNNAGHWLFDPNRTIDTLARVASTVDVAGNLTVGSAYAGTNAAPANGLIVQGNTGIGTPTPAYPLQINEPLNGQGTISVTAGSGTVTGTGTNFLADFWIGDVINANGELRTITAIPSATSMTTDNWTNTYNGAYTTNNTKRYTFSGKGALYLGDPVSTFTNDAFVQTTKTFTNNKTGIFGIWTSMTSNQTTAPISTGVIGTTAIVSVGVANTQNWTSPFGLIGVQGTASIRGAATGTITGAAGISSSIANNSSAAILTNGYVFKGTVSGVASSITNATGAFLYGLGRATNNTGIYLDANSALAAIPTGNWGVYDNTGYKNYFAGSIGIGTTTPYAGAKFQTKLNTDINLGIDAGTGTGAIRLDAYNDAANANIPLELQGSTISMFGSGGALGLFVNSTGSVAIGTTDPKSYKLAVAGNAIAESMTVKLQANWPDYAFKKDYRLMPLSELKAYVDKNQHLPEIPSAAQVEKEGINLGEMNKLLVKKVEELTLYLIEQNKRIEKLEAQVKQKQ